MLCRFALCILFALVSSAGYCESESTYDRREEKALSNLLAQANIQQLAKDPHWLKLLHYRNAQSDSGSDVITPEFFLSPTGNIDPKSELIATIAALLQPIDSDENQHPRCRFPARQAWLQQRLDWTGVVLPSIQCKAFEDWSLHGDTTSISLIFASGYLSNPASLYGHLLIKFNTANSAANGKLLDPSLSYGAVVPRHENGLVYALKGLFGGYTAGFSHDKFYQHNHNYGETELRDLWEYELNLNESERYQIIAHSWELLQVRFRYYFLSDNCAFRVADLLGLVIAEPLLPGTPWSIPSTVVDQIITISKDGKPLFSHVEFIPSRQRRLYQKYSALDAFQKEKVLRIAKNNSSIASELDTNIRDEDKISVIETLFDFYEFRSAAAMDKSLYNSEKRQLLTRRLQLPPNNPSAMEVAQAPPAPHETQPPFLLQIAALNNSSFDAGLELRIRPAYYDMLADDRGRSPYTSLSMFDLRLVYMGDQLRLRSLNLLNIENMNISNSDLPGDGGYAWKINSGFEQQNLACYQCTIFFAEGGIGKAVQPHTGVVLYSMLSGRAQTTAENSGTLAGTAKIGALIDISSNWRSGASFEYRKYLNGSEDGEPILRLENRFSVDNHWDLRLDFTRDVAEEVRAAATYYW